MEKVFVQSSNVKSVSYDSSIPALLIEYKNGDIWSYPGVTHDEYMVMLDKDKTPSIGSYVHTVIKTKYGKDATKVHKHGEGYLHVGEKITSNNPIKSGVNPTHCPACGRKAKGWEPPVSDPRYVQRVEREKELFELKTDEEAHSHFLKSNGYVETCSNSACEVSFFVPPAAAQLKETKE